MEALPGVRPATDADAPGAEGDPTT
jgi:hypothetical protein